MPPQARDAVLIVNPMAGGGRLVHQLDEGQARFPRRGHPKQNFRRRPPPVKRPRLRVAPSEQSRQLVIVCGGDGTVNEAVNGLACSQVPLAVLPAGTANVLAKELSLPWNLPRAAKIISNAPYRRIALGLATPEPSSGAPRYFLSVAGAGPDGTLVAAVRPEIKLRSGILAYWLEEFSPTDALHVSEFPSNCRVGHESIVATMVILGRTKHYGGPFKIHH